MKYVIFSDLVEWGCSYRSRDLPKINHTANGVWASLPRRLKSRTVSDRTSYRVPNLSKSRNMGERIQGYTRGKPVCNQTGAEEAVTQQRGHVQTLGLDFLTTNQVNTRCSGGFAGNYSAGKAGADSPRKS